MAGDHGVDDPPSGLCPVLYRIGKRPFKGMRLQSNYAPGSRRNAPKPGVSCVQDGESQETHAVEDATQYSRSTAPCVSQDVRSVPVPSPLRKTPHLRKTLRLFCQEYGQSTGSLSIAKMQRSHPIPWHSVCSIRKECPPVTQVSASSRMPCARCPTGRSDLRPQQIGHLSIM